MLRLKRLSSTAAGVLLSSRVLFVHEDKLVPMIPAYHPSHWTPTRSLDIYQFGNKDAIEKERARLKDEMNRGYFADISEMKKHGGKIAKANKVIIPEMAAVKFPSLEVNYSDGSCLKLPITSNSQNSRKSDAPKATLLCLSFRASSQALVNSWSSPFHKAFINSKTVQLYEISLIDSWLLSCKPIKKLLLRIMRKSCPNSNDVLQREIVYSFGDHYYFRKELKILNVLTGYIFLLDKFGRIRWQGSGLATQGELSSLMSCTSLLSEEA